MAQTFIWKPSTIGSWKGGIAFLADSAGSRTAPTITAPNGQTYTGKYVNTNEGRHQWLFPSELAQMSNLQVNYNGQTGTIGNGAMSYEGSSLGGWQERAKGSLGDMGGGYPMGFAPGMAGQYGAYPAYLGGMFPSPAMMNPAAYQFVDPVKQAKRMGKFNRKEILKNFDLSKDLAIKSLDAELASLKDFIPAASAIKRQEISADNIFNQAERIKQVNSALPGAVEDLEAQRQRANTFANGQIPDPIQDRAYELGVRSAAADSASRGGFGQSSSVARKASDLMSVSQRLNLSNYGDRLLSSNLSDRAKLLLAPTEYSNAGSQVSVMPSLSTSQLINSNLNAINGLTTITPSQSLSSVSQQRQFVSGLEQQANMFNATAQNQFALDLFGYQAGFANSVAGASQANINTQFQVDQQNLFRQIMEQYANNAQNAGSIQSLLSGITTLFPNLIGGIANSIGDFGGGIFQGISGTISPTTSGIEEKGQNIGSFLSDAGSSIVHGIRSLF